VPVGEHGHAFGIRVLSAREEHSMCVDESPQHNPHRLLRDVGPVEVLDLEPVDAVTVTTLMDNSLDLFMTDREVPDALIAEHGFSMLVTVSKAGREHRVLFDTGTSPDGVVQNMRRLDVDPSSIEAIVCSHGHFDHTAGLDGLLRVLGPTGMPVLIHPHFWRRRRALVPGREPFELPTTSATALREVGFDIIENEQPSFLLDRSVLITGEVPRVSGYEPGFPIQQAWIDEGWQPDPLVLDDQALIVKVRGKGLIVITGCGHAGVVNISRYARRLTGEQPLHALLGGFHLNGPLFEPLIPRVLDDLALLGPQVLVPAHCTGWRAQHALAARFGEAFVPNSIGTRFIFQASPQPSLKADAG
jgi:7,8-dihydropterin-6-yl-methyl-4-(beta-D-ribofuranosyl)aminobenzene 5'-phosphate synthase